MSFLQGKKVGLFYGSDTGNTEEITHQLADLWKASELEIIEARSMNVTDYARFDILLLGLSTWYDGELQSDFDSFFEEFLTIDFTGKIVALYGLGDQYGYGENFVDGLGILGEVILQNGGEIIGMWPTKGYEFDESKGLFKEGLFYGLALDFENQMDLNDERLETWVQQVEGELRTKMAA